MQVKVTASYLQQTITVRMHYPSGLYREALFQSDVGYFGYEPCGSVVELTKEQFDSLASILEVTDQVAQYRVKTGLQ